MKLLYELLALLVLSSFFFYIDRNRCSQGNGILFAHHIIATFFRFWWLSNNLVLLVVFAITPFFYLPIRMFNGNKCFLTQMHNKACGNPVNLKFDDIFNKIGLSTCDWWINVGDKVMVVVVWIIVMIKLIQNHGLKYENGGIHF